jgi:hypothetical protein
MPVAELARVPTETTPNSMEVTFRPPRAAKYPFLAFAALFFAAAIGGPLYLASLEDPAAHGFKGEHSLTITATAVIVVFGGFGLLSCYVFAAYHRYRLTLTASGLVVRGLFSETAIEFSDIDRLDWHTNNFGHVRIRAARKRCLIEMASHPRTDRVRIIEMLRPHVPAEKQVGWPMFCHKVALPLRERQAYKVRLYRPEQLQLITRKRYDKFLYIALPASCAAAGTLWAWLGQPKFIAIPVAVIGGWAVLRLLSPRDGLQYDKNREGVGAWAALFASLMSWPFVLVGLKFAGVEED